MDYNLFNDVGDWLTSQLKKAIQDIRENGVNQRRLNRCEELKARINQWNNDFKKIMERK